MKLLYRVLLTSALLLLVAEAAFSAPTPRRITLEHPLFRVGYSSQGVNFAPSGGDLTWSWQLSGLSGLANIPLTGISPVAEDKNVSYNRGILTEHYLFKTNLIEQQFTLSTAEGLHGDLVIEGQIAANGDFSPVEGGWRWSRKDQHLFLGDVTVYDARGNLLEATMTVTATSSRIVVPFQALRHATFPVTIDPQIGPDDFVLHNTAPKSYQPRMVYNTATDAFFAVWTNYQGSGLPRNENIHGAAFTRAQIVASPSLVDQFCDYPSFLVSGTPPANAGLNSSATRADVAFSGDKHLVVWEDYRGSTSSTREVKIQLTTGTAVSGDTTALFKDVVFVSTYGQAHYPAVAGNNTAFLVTCVAGKTSLSPASYSVAGQFIDPAGTPVAGYLPIFNDAAEFTDVDVDARGDGNFALVASTLNTIHYGWASATEMVSTGKLTAAGQIGSVAVAAGKDNSSALLVWSELSGTGADAKYIIMGNTAGKTFQISPANQYSAGQPAVAYNPDTDSWLVVWQASPSLGPTSGTMIWGCEVSAAGTPGQEFPLSKQSRTSVSPTVAYDEDLDEFWIAWSGGGNKDQLLAQRWINHLNDCVISVEKDFTPENNYLSPLNKSTDIFVTALQAKTASGEALYPLVFTLKDSAVFRTSYSATRLTVTKPASSLADYNVARNQLFYVRDDSLNYEKENVLSFSVRAASVPAAPAGPTVYHDDTIRIADVNEMFAATFSAAVTFLEDQPGAMIPFTYHSGDKGRERNTLSLAVTAYPPILNTAPTLQSNPSYPGGGHTDPIPRTAETKTEALLVPLKANATGSGNLTFNLTDLKGGVWASSQNDLTSSFTVRVTVLPVNDPPQGYDRTDMLTEDGSYSFSSGSFGFFDLNDSPSNQLSAVIITTLPARGSMTLDGVAVTAGQSIAAADLGQLMYKPVAQESGFGYTSFTFQVQDDGDTANGGIDTDPTPRTFTLDVWPVNDPPSGIDKTITLAEDASYTFAAADFGFSDPVDGPANQLKAVVLTTLPASGVLQLNGAAVTATQAVPAEELSKLTFTPAMNESGSPYASFTFQVQDNGGTTDGGIDTDPTPNTLTIHVNPLNDAPAGSDQSITLAENQIYPFTVANFGFSDPDDTPPHTFKAVVLTTLPASGLLHFNGAAVTSAQVVPVAVLNQLTYTPAVNGSGIPYASFTFQVQDDGGTAGGGIDTDPTPNTLTINVTPVNKAPAGTDKNLTLQEDQAYTFAAADFGFSDPNDAPAHLFQAVLITTLPATGSLQFDGAAVTATQVVPVIDLGLLTYTPEVNGSGTPYASFTFQVQDDGGTSNGGTDTDPTPNTVTISVTPVNDAPAGTDRTITLLEDNTYTFSTADFGFSDPDDAPANQLNAVVLTTLPAMGVLQLNGAVVTATQVVPVADLGQLTFTPVANGNGTPYASFTFQVQDDGGTASGGTDTDPTPNTLTINVTSVNDAPESMDFTIAFAEDFVYAFDLISPLLFDNNDTPPNQPMGVVITTLPTRGVLKLGGTAVTALQVLSSDEFNNLTYTPAANQYGIPLDSLTFQVQDDGGRANGGIDTDPTPNTITMNVVPWNDAPEGTDQSVNLYATEAYAFKASDFGYSDPNDTPPHLFKAVIITTLPGAGVLQFDGAAVTARQSVPVADLGKLIFTPAADGYGTPYASFTFQVQDDGASISGGTDTDPTPNTLTINLTPINNPPFGADKSITLLEDIKYTFTAADFGFSDPDDSPAHQLKAVLLSTLPAAGVLQLNGATVTATRSIAAADLGQLTFTPAANGNGSPYASFTFQVQDDGGTAHGGIDTDPTPNSITLNVTPVNDSPLISVSSTQQTVQYSDPILPVTVTTSDVDNAYGQLILSAAWKEASQSAFTPGLPPDVQLTEVPGNSFPKHWTLSGNINVPQGTYILRMTVTDGDPDPLTNSAYADLEITVTPEDARITFTGAFFATTASTSSSTVVVPLSALIRGGAAGTSDQDNSPGDIRNARVTFTIVETGQTFGPLTPELVSPDDPSTGTVHTEWMAELGTSEAKVYTIAMKVGGSYLRESAEDDAVVTVSKPLNDFITGGGFIGLVNSGGTMAGDKGSRNHFGFSLKFNTYKTILRGQINLLIRRTVNDVVRTYQIKGSKMTFLTVTQGTSAGPGTAGFYGTGAIQDITDPLLPVTIEENAIIQMVMTDFGDPGSGGNDPVADRIGITIRTTFGGLWYSSLTDGKKTLEQKLDGGNLRIRNVFRIITGNTPSTTRLVTSAEPSFPGKQVSFTATVTGSLPIKPTGSVLFYDYFNGTQKLLGKTTLNQGVATLTTSSLPAGIHEITAYYVGDFRYACSASLINQTIGFSANDPDEKIFLSNNGSVLSVYPNPFSDKLNFRLLPAIDDYARIDLFDINGRYIKTIFNQKVKAGMLYQAVYIPYTQVKGTYMYRVTLGRWLWTGKVLYQPLR